MVTLLCKQRRILFWRLRITLLQRSLSLFILWMCCVIGSLSSWIDSATSLNTTSLNGPKEKCLEGLGRGSVAPRQNWFSGWSPGHQSSGQPVSWSHLENILWNWKWNLMFLMVLYVSRYVILDAVTFLSVKLLYDGSKPLCQSSTHWKLKC